MVRVSGRSSGGRRERERARERERERESEREREDAGESPRRRSVFRPPPRRRDTGRTAAETNRSKTHIQALEADAEHDGALLQAALEVLNHRLLLLARQRVADLRVMGEGGIFGGR
jgi:hypothetical protein